MLVETINYLSHFIQPGGLEMAEATTSVVQELQYPTLQTEVHSFLGT